MNAPNSHAPEQFFLPMFTQHEIDVWTYEEQKRLERIERRKRRVPTVWIPTNSHQTKVLDAFSADLLDQPFGPNSDPELQDLGDPYVDIDMEEEHIADNSDEDKESWSDDAVDQLHEGMLLYSLRLLNARGNGKEKKSLLRWIFDPAAMAVATSQDADVWKFIDPSKVPFSFELCCRVAGYDSERLKAGLVPVLKNLGLGALFKEMEDESNTKRAADVQHALNLRLDRGAGKCGNSRGQTPGRAAAGNTKSRPALCL